MLTPETLAYFRLRLDAAFNDVQRALDLAAANDAGTVIPNQSKVGRLSHMDALQQQAMAAGWKETLQRENRRIVAAWPRLEADLGLPFCTDCQTEIEAGRTTRR